MKLLDYLSRLNRGSNEANKAYGKVIPRKEQITMPTSGQKSSKVSKTASLMGGLATNGGYRERPFIQFDRRFEYYLTISKIQNVVDGIVLDIKNRKHFFQDTTDGGMGGAYSPELRNMEKWEKQTVQLSTMLGETVRNWLIAGTHIISPIDWMPLQLRSIKAKLRDDSGNTTHYVQVINGQEVFLEADMFLETHYISIDRAAWGVGLFDSIMNNAYLDIDGKQPESIAEIYRQTIQDHGKIIHKYSNPLTIYMPEDNEAVMGNDTIDNDIVPLLEGMKNGDRIVINKRLKILQETVDGKARFVEYSNQITDELETGLQSSKNRLITKPSAMADAEEAGEQDDDRILGIMDDLTIFMNKSVIPAVLGIDAGIIEFAWGEKDEFKKIVPKHIDRALELGIIAPEEARQLLEEQHEWTFPVLDEVNQQLMDDRMDMAAQAQDQSQLNDDEKKANNEALQHVRLEKQSRTQNLALINDIRKQLSDLR